MSDDGCCAPARSADPSAAAHLPEPGLSRPASHSDTMHLIAAGTFSMGSDDPGSYPDDGEGPVRPVTVNPFMLDSRCVSNAEFAAFVAASGFRTDAERLGSSFVFAGLLPDDVGPTRAVVGAEWWREVLGADWMHPEGPHSTLDGRELEPVVQVSFNDAVGYCRWAGLRLPSEPEWEFAARGGLEGCRFPWGNKLQPDGEHRMNVWQGRFPTHNSLADGYLGPAPVDAFPANGYGLHNMTGNVWEWTADTFVTPWSSAVPAARPGQEVARRQVLKGGSYLCHASYCFRYRVSARMGNTPDTSTGNIGFRCAADRAAD